MSLPDHIDQLLLAGKIPPRFCVADVEKHLHGIYAANYIRTALANFAKDTAIMSNAGADRAFVGSLQGGMRFTDEQRAGDGTPQSRVSYPAVHSLIVFLLVFGPAESPREHGEHRANTDRRAPGMAIS